MNNLAGTKIDHYEIQAPLGQGGMGAVYRAYDLNLARPVALKVMHAQLAGQEEFQKRFYLEARSVAGLSHPSIVTIHHFGQSQGLLYMVMAYIAGGSLSAHLHHLQQSGRAVQLREILLFLAQVADALGYAHRHGVIHRDIKPSNVLIQRLEMPDGEGDLPFRAIVTDFGLAKLLTGGVETKSDALLGTYPYMSPEQCLQRPVDGRSDIYSLGVMLYQLTTGKLPLDIQSATDAVLKHHTNQKPLPPREAWPGLPVSVEAVINRAIAHNPEDRYQSGEAVAADLRGAVKSLADKDITEFESQRTVQSLSTRLEPEAPAAEPSRMGLDLPRTSPGDRIIIAQKEHTPHSIHLDKAQLTIGRSSDNDIVVNHADVSRQHARLERTSTGWQVTDLGSTNGTYLDGNRLLAGISEALSPGKMLRIGPYFIHWQQTRSRTVSQSLVRSSGLLSSRATHFQSQSGNIGVNIQPGRLEIVPGDREQVQVDLFNESDLVDHFTLRLEGLPSGWFTFIASTSELMPGESGSLTLNLHPPQDASAREGLYPYRLIITSQAKPGESVTVPGELIVKPFERFSVEIQPSQLSSGRTTQVTIRNGGNAEGTYSLAGRDPANAVQFAGEHGRIKVPAGGAAIQLITAQARNRPLFGAVQTLPFEIEVSSTSQQSHAISGQLKVSPLIPRWILSLSSLLVTICILSVGFIYFGLIAPQIPAPQAQTKTFSAAIVAARQSATQAAQEMAIAGTNSAISMLTEISKNTLTPTPPPVSLTSTLTSTPTETPSPTPTLTPSPTPTSLINGYQGTWLYSGSNSGTLSFALYRLIIENVDFQNNTATFSVCRCTQKDSCAEKSNLTPLLVGARFTASKLVAADPVYIDQQRTIQWRLGAIKVGQNLRVTVEQYKGNTKMGGPEDFVMSQPKSPIIPGSGKALDVCQPPPVILILP